jgi:hypothetical protein
LPSLRLRAIFDSRIRHNHTRYGEHRLGLPRRERSRVAFA